MRVGHHDGQPCPLTLQAGDDNGGVPALRLGIGQGAVGRGQARWPHVDRPQVPHAGDGARAPARADRDRSPLPDVRQPFGVQDGGEQAGGIATHLGHGAIGVVVVHEPLGLGHGLMEGLRTRQGGRAHDPHEPVGAEPRAPVAHGGDVGGAHGHPALGVDEHEEIILGAMTLDELVAGQAGGSSHGPQPRRRRGCSRPPERPGELPDASRVRVRRAAIALARRGRRRANGSEGRDGTT